MPPDEHQPLLGRTQQQQPQQQADTQQQRHGKHRPISPTHISVAPLNLSAPPLQPSPAPSTASIASSSASGLAASASASSRELLWAILTLSGPISLTTVVEFLPQILISAMVGHSNPRTALSLHDDKWTSDREGALLETYGLATLVYSTAAFSLVYGFICGLDSVASCSYGMTVDAATSEGSATTDDGSTVPSAQSTPLLASARSSNSASRQTSSSSRPRSPVRSDDSNGTRNPKSILLPLHGRPRKSGQMSVPQGGPAAAIRNQARSSVNWASPPLRGVVGVTMSPAQKALTGKKGSSPNRMPLFSSHAMLQNMQRSPSAPLHCDSEDAITMLSCPSSSHVATAAAALDARQRTAALDVPTNGSRRGSRGGSISNSKTRPPTVAFYGSFPPPDTSGSSSLANGVGSSWPVGHDEGEDEELGRVHDQGLRAHNLHNGELRAPQPWAPLRQGVTSCLASALSAVQRGSHEALVKLEDRTPVTPDPMAQFELGAGAASIVGAQQKATARVLSHQNSAADAAAAAGAAARCAPSPQQPSSLIGTWIARCLMLELIVVCLLIVLLHWGTEPLLRALGEPSESIPVAAAYVTAASFGLPFVAVYHALNKGLQSSGVVMPILLISVVAKAVCLLGVYLALYQWNMNLVAVAWILSATMAAQATAVYVYMRCTGIAEQWWGGAKAAVVEDESQSTLAAIFNFAGLWEYVVLAVPACMAICLEFWLFDLLGALAGLLPDPATELAVHYLLFTATLTSYMVFSGLSVSVSVLVGQRLGCAGQSANAKRSAIVGTSACLCVSALLMLLITLFHETLARALTSQPSLLARFGECVPVLVAYQAVDGLNTCSTQLLRTLGVQKYGVLLHFSTYYLIGMSSSIILAFKLGWGVQGLWIGLCIGVGMNASIATVWLWRFADWEDQSQAAQSRAVAMCGSTGAGDTPAAFLATSDSYVSEVEEQPHAPIQEIDQRTSLFALQAGLTQQDQHGN